MLTVTKMQIFSLGLYIFHIRTLFFFDTISIYKSALIKYYIIAVMKESSDRCKYRKDFLRKIDFASGNSLAYFLIMAT